MEKLDTIIDNLRTFAALLADLAKLENEISGEINNAEQQNRELFELNGENRYCDERDGDIQTNLQKIADSLSDNYRKIKNFPIMSEKVGKILASYDKVFVHEYTNKSGYPQIKSLLEKLREDIKKLEDLLYNG